MESPPRVQPMIPGGRGVADKRSGRFFATTPEMGRQFVCVHGDCVVALDAGATANLLCCERFGNRNSHLQKRGTPQVSTYPKKAHFEFGDGRIGEVHYAADLKVGIAGRRGACAAFAPGADIPALLRKGALEALGGQLDFAREVLAIRNRGLDIPPKVNDMGHDILSVVAFGDRPPCVDRGPKLAASYFEWALLGNLPDLSNGGLHLPSSEDGW